MARLGRLWWLNVLLFGLTLATTTVFGSALAVSFAAGRPLDLQDIVDGYDRLLQGDLSVWHGLSFSAPLLLILLTHELGHYVKCIMERVDASLPYFLPSPTLFGTLGAFIRIRSPIYTQRALFDIGIAGPIAGFLLLLPFLVVGVWLSHPLPAALADRSLIIGAPLVVRAVEWLRFGNVSPSRILLHPMAVAALGGLLTTALNLLPMGQLDGGHILYSLGGERRHKLISSAVVCLLAVLGFAYWPWWVWAVLMFILGRRHPLVYDEALVVGRRRWLALAALFIFILSISLVPTRIDQPLR